MVQEDDSLKRLTLSLLLTVLLSAVGSAEAADCLRPVVAGSDDETAYKDRGAYCEGLYKQPFSAVDEFSIVGFHAAPLELPASPFKRTAFIYVHASLDEEITVKVSDISSLVFYQLDFTASSDMREMQWSLSIVRNPKVALRGEQLAALACSGDCASRQPTYLPVAVGVSEASSASPQLVVYVPRATEALFMTITDVDSGERIGERVWDPFRMQTTRAVHLDLPELSAARAVRVDLVAALQNGVSAATSARLIAPN